MIELLVVEEQAQLSLNETPVQVQVTGEEAVELIQVNQPNTLLVVDETTVIAEVSEVGPPAVEWGTNDYTEGDPLFAGQTLPDGTWRIKQVSDTSVSYATVANNPTVTLYTDAWTNKATLTYERYEEAF